MSESVTNVSSGRPHKTPDIDERSILTRSPASHTSQNLAQPSDQVATSLAGGTQEGADAWSPNEGAGGVLDNFLDDNNTSPGAKTTYSPSLELSTPNTHYSAPSSPAKSHESEDETWRRLGSIEPAVDQVDNRQRTAHKGVINTVRANQATYGANREGTGAASRHQEFSSLRAAERAARARSMSRPGDVGYFNAILLSDSEDNQNDSDSDDSESSIGECWAGTPAQETVTTSEEEQPQATHREESIQVAEILDRLRSGEQIQTSTDQEEQEPPQEFTQTSFRGIRLPTVDPTSGTPDVEEITPDEYFRSRNRRYVSTNQLPDSLRNLGPPEPVVSTQQCDLPSNPQDQPKPDDHISGANKVIDLFPSFKMPRRRGPRPVQRPKPLPQPISCPEPPPEREHILEREPPLERELPYWQDVPRSRSVSEQPDLEPPQPITPELEPPQPTTLGLEPPRLAAHEPDASFVQPTKNSLLTPRRHNLRSRTRVPEFNQAVFDSQIYGQPRARRPDGLMIAPAPRRTCLVNSPSVQYIYADPRIHGMHTRSSKWHDSKDKEIANRPGRKSYFGESGARKRKFDLLEQQESLEDSRNGPQPRGHGRPMDFSNVPEEDLPDYVKQNPKWLACTRWLRESKRDQEAVRTEAKKTALQASA